MVQIKLCAPAISDTLTYHYSLCIQKWCNFSMGGGGGGGTSLNLLMSHTMISFENWQCIGCLLRHSIASYLTDRKQTVTMNASTVNAQSLRYGIPHSSILGPSLSSVCINDLPGPLFIKAYCELFADDAPVHNSNSSLKKLRSLYRRV